MSLLTEAAAATCDSIGTTWYEFENVIYAKPKVRININF
jgi:hypothetical protein